MCDSQILAPASFIIGAGPVATALAVALRQAGVPVVGVWARRRQAVDLIAAAAGIAGFSAELPAQLADAEAVIVAVRDDAITEMTQRLVVGNHVGADHVLVHCSGARPAEQVFAPALGRVGGVATLHPLRAIADGVATGQAIAGTVFGLEGDERGRARASALVAAMGGRPLQLEAAEMAGYHAAAVMASNYVVALLDGAAAALGGKAAPEVVSALLALARGSLDNVGEHGVEGGLTGPIRRGDVATVARHLDALPASILPLYRVMGRQTLAIVARMDGADSEQLGQIADLLADPP